MHAEAMPDAEPASLQSPDVVAEKIAMMIRRSNQIDGIQNVTRVVASDYQNQEGLMKAAARLVTIKQK